MATRQAASMSTRSEFLNLAVKGLAMNAAAALFAWECISAGQYKRWQEHE
jgi:hypothetical protein